MGERGFTDPSQRQGRYRDSELGGRQIGIKIIDGVLERARVHVLLRDQFRHAAAADRNERKLGGDEKAVRTDEQKHGKYPEKIENTAIGTGHGLPSGGQRLGLLKLEPAYHALGAGGRLEISA